MRSTMAVDPSLVSGGKDVVIYGTGRMALLTFTALLQEGVAVAAFCGEESGSRIMGKPVISPDEMKARADGTSVVFAGENLASAEKEMAALGIEDFWADVHAYSVVNDCVWSFM